ncbi:MAG: hypothetical protein R3Y26_05860 [Rikenellaceae bacterium]
MKKIKFILTASFFSIGVFVYQNLSMTEHERMAIANIEALSSDGEAEGSRISCSSTIVNENSGTITKTKCSTCLDVLCTDYSSSSTCKK